MAIKIYEQFAPFANQADGDYPYGSIKNDSIPGAEDGTPLDAVWGNDMVGFTDALLAEAGIVPNGQPDKLGASQRVDAIKKISGTIYSSVADMIAKSGDGVGAVVRTLSYYDGVAHGSASYKIISGTVADGTADHVLANNRVAQLILSDSPIITQWGAKPNDASFNNTPFIQAAIAKLSGLATADSKRVLFSPNAVFWMGAAGANPRVSLLSNVYLWSYYTTFKCSSGVVRDTNSNSIFLFGGLSTRIPCHNSGILGVATIDGNRDNNGATSGDESWHSGIRLDRNSRDVTFGDLLIKDVSCDGILLSQLGFPYDKDEVPTNVKFGRVIVDRAYRNGVSLVDFDNVTFDYLETINTQGTAPQAGLDVEPNYREARARGLYIGHFVTKNNFGSGLDVLLHNNNSEQSAGTFGRIDSHDNENGIKLYTCVGLNILSGTVSGSKSYALYALSVLDTKIKARFIDNRYGVSFDDLIPWRSESDVNGSTSIIIYHPENIDLSGSIFMNNGGTQLSIKGSLFTDPVTGAPRIYKLNGFKFNDTNFNNRDSGATNTAEKHVNIRENVAGYQAIGATIVSDAVTPVLINNESSGVIIGGSAVNPVTLAVPAISNGASAVVTTQNRAGTRAYGRVSCRAVQATPLEIKGVVVSGTNLLVTVANYSGTNQLATVIEAVISADVPYFT